MTDDGSKEDTNWPMPKFRFEVDLGTENKSVFFQEVSGLESETQIIKYETNKSTKLDTVKMLGIAKYDAVTLKRGVFVNDNTFWDWYQEIKMNTVKRRTVLIKLLDESGATTMSWTLENAWPVKVKGTDLKSDGNEVAVDTIEIAYEELTIKNS